MANVYKNIAGVRVPSVTTIIESNLGWNKRVLMAWQARMFREGKDPDKIKGDAADLGTLVHDFVESYIYGDEIKQDVLAKYSMDQIAIAERGLEQFKEISNREHFEWLETEMALVSEVYQYGGRLDGLCTRGFKPAICLADTKTSSGIYDEYIVQLAGYRGLLRECTDYNPKEFFFIHISKDPSLDLDKIIEIIDVPEEALDVGWTVFKSLLEQHKAKAYFRKILK